MGVAWRGVAWRLLTVACVLSQLISQAKDMSAVADIFLAHSRSILNKIAPYKAQASMIIPVQERVESICLAALPYRNIRDLFSFRIVALVAAALAFCLRFLNTRSKQWHGHFMPPINNSADVRVPCWSFPGRADALRALSCFSSILYRCRFCAWLVPSCAPRTWLRSRACRWCCPWCPLRSARRRQWRAPSVTPPCMMRRSCGPPRIRTCRGRRRRPLREA